MKSNRTLLVWLVVLLAVLNISTVAALLYHKQQHKQNNELLMAGSGQVAINGSYFRHQLQFDSLQMSGFRHAQRNFQPKVKEILMAIDSLKGAMHTELTGAHPDTLLLNRISHRIGENHALLKKETYKFYLSLCTLCSVQQKEQLQQTLLPIFCDCAGNRQTAPDQIMQPGERGRRNRLQHQ
ncbi:MAG: hypothetical protein AB7C90_03325 [Bacteroidales bacterium]